MDAKAKALVVIGEAANSDAGQKAVQLDLASKAIEAKEKIAKESTIVLLPDSSNDVASLVAQSMAIIEKISKKDTPADNINSDDQAPPQPWKG